MLRRISPVVLVLLVFAALALVGCQSIGDKVAEKAVESATGLKVDQEGDSVTITGEDGSQLTAGGSELPEGFPDDVAIYGDSPLASSLKSEESYTVSFETADEWTEVWQWYLDDAKAQGWEIKNELKMEDGGMITGLKDTRQLQVSIGASSTEGMKTFVTLFVGPQ